MVGTLGSSLSAGKPEDDIRGAVVFLRQSQEWEVGGWSGHSELARVQASRA